MEASAVVAPPQSSSHASRPVWRVGWLTPWRCRVILVLLLGYGFYGHLQYLRQDCPIDLSGDEAHYWDWSRQLDLSYYSKGPLVALLIRASCAAFGDVMWAVRFPALVLGVGTSLLTYALTKKLFGSDRLALGAVLLNHIVPMFIAGSVLMTIDPPFYFCWALATYLLAGVLFGEGRWRGWLWAGIGAAVGVGFLAKYAMLLWLPIALLVLWADGPRGRRELRAWSGWVTATLVALLFTLPVIAWNARHHWVSFRHVGKQTGAAGATASPLLLAPLRVVEFLAGQAAVIGPPLAVMIIAAVIYTRRRRKAAPEALESRRLGFLVWVGLPFLALATLTNLRAKGQLNWPAPAYFTLMILVAYFLSTRLRDPWAWRPWRKWFYPAVAFGLITMPIAHDMSIVYPAMDWFNRKIGPRFGIVGVGVRQLDFTAKLRGWEELGAFVSEQVERLGPGAFIVSEDYQTTAELAFYAKGQPKTYYLGSYLSSDTKRQSQYDVWPDRSLDPRESPGLVGKDAVFVGWFKPDLWDAFEVVEELPLLDIERQGIKIRKFRVYRCYNFRGMTRPARRQQY
jgi:4-amino-4-deoxy-L-arabinose transferase-like glycosyltransferase